MSIERYQTMLPVRPSLSLLVAVVLMVGSHPVGAGVAKAIPGCDFNGDGFHDLAIGVPGESEGALPSGAGAVNVIYGTADGLWATGNQFWTQDTPGVKDIAEASDAFGTAVACGDFNNDGWDDLAIGVENERIAGTGYRGAVHILLGSAAGLTAERDQFWHFGNIPGTGLKSSRGFGRALAVGDFDADGHDDLAIGAPETDAGVVVVLKGGETGLTATGSQLWSQASPGIVGTAQEGEGFGSALASGDLNGDNHDDLVIGVPGDNAIDGLAGGVNVILGGAGGLSAIDNQHWTLSAPGIQAQGDGASSDLCGFSVAVGDFDGDGHDDVAMGCPGKGIKPHTVWAGGVFLFYGCGEGLCEKGSMFINQDTAGVQGGADYDDEFGYALTAADFNGDGYSDLAVGARGETGDAAGVDWAGAVNVLYGRKGGGLSWSQIFHQSMPSILGTADEFDMFGSSLTSGDFDGDGVSDLAVGAYNDSPSGLGGGAVNVIYGTILLLQSAGNQLWSQDSAFILGTQNAGSGFGHLGGDPSFP